MHVSRVIIKIILLFFFKKRLKCMNEQKYCHLFIYFSQTVNVKRTVLETKPA